MRTKKNSYCGFTLIELLMAMIVSAIILTAVSTLAFSMGTASDSSEDSSQKQAQLRQATLRVSELIRQCRLVVLATPYEIALWQADFNIDNRINLNELVYIESGELRDHLRVVRFNSSDNPVINLDQIDPLSSSWWSGFNVEIRATDLIPVCSNVEFRLDASPPYTKTVGIKFGLEDNGVIRNYQINNTLRCRSANLLDVMGNLLPFDDD